MNFNNPLADCVHNGNRHAVACLFVKLGVGIDGGSLIKHIIGKALQPPALTGRQLADSSAAKRYALITGSIKRLRATLTHTTTAGITVGESKIDTVAAFRLSISGGGSVLYFQSVFAGITGAEINAVFVLRVQAKGRFAALLETASVLPFILTVRGQYGAAAIKNAGAFTPVAYPDFVVACDQAFRVILFPDFWGVSF